MPDVTILIRARNEEQLLPRCLRMIFAQETSFTFDVLLIDSGSTDRTVAVARQFPGVAVREIEPHRFNYGTTLNEGTRLARGRYVAALSAHCVPVDRHWLQRLVEPLEGDAAVGAAFGRQIPWRWCEPLERYYLRKEFGERDYVLDGANLDGNPFKTLFSNANSCYRRELALAIPFQALPWAEDRVWAHAVLRAQHKVAYASRAVVYHSHRRSIRAWYRHGRIDGQLNTLFGVPPFRLQSCPWFGVRALRRYLDRWFRTCLAMGYPRSSSLRLGLGAAARAIAHDLGKVVGQRSPLPDTRQQAGNPPPASGTAP